MRVILAVIDGFGIGAMEDASLYGDSGANTYRSILPASLPNLISLGLNNIYGVKALKMAKPLGVFARMRELSAGKDTLTGHYELAGVISYEPQPLFPDGFPDKLIKKLEKAFGRSIIGNIAASGTEIIKQYGAEHVKTGSPIVYTSADSVLQIACHEKVVPLEELYAMCAKARKIMSGEYAVGRIIARPFVGKKGNYSRTENRRDYPVQIGGDNLLTRLQKSGVNTIAIGKINDIFAGRGIDSHIEAHNNVEVGAAIAEQLSLAQDNSFVFANFVDTDMLYGHRRDVAGYKKCMTELDQCLGAIMSGMTDSDILFIVSDHGCDPSFTSTTDHTREYAPLLIYGRSIKAGYDLGTVHGFDHVAHTILDLFDIMSTAKSFAGEITVKEQNGGLLSKMPIYGKISQLINGKTDK